VTQFAIACLDLANQTRLLLRRLAPGGACGRGVGPVGTDAQQVFVRQTRAQGVNLSRVARAEKVQVQSGIVLRAQELFIGQSTDLLVRIQSGPLPCGAGCFLGQHTQDGLGHLVFFASFLGQVLDEPVAGLRLRAHPAVLEPAGVGQMHEPFLIEQIVEHTAQTVRSETLDDLLGRAVHQDSTGHGNRGRGVNTAARHPASRAENY
jgi:hypothetical protein